MTSAAKYLYDFFTADPQTRTSFRQLIEATNELEDELQALSTAGVKVQPFLRLLPRLRSEFYSHADQELKTVGPRTAGLSVGHPARLDERDLALLELAIEKTALAASEMNSQREENMRSLLDAVSKMVVSDESLDPQLRLFIARALVSVRNALDEYEITGEFRLREALLSLFGLLSTAEAQSDDATGWRKVWEKYGVPATAGLIASIPQMALTGTTLLNALGSGSS